jgi:hypothetical protein
MKSTHMPNSAPSGSLEVSRRYACDCQILARVTERISSVGSGKGDIEFP